MKKSLYSLMLAEDVVRGYNTPDACVFLMKNRMQKSALEDNIYSLEDPLTGNKND